MENLGDISQEPLYMASDYVGWVFYDQSSALLSSIYGVLFYLDNPNMVLSDVRFLVHDGQTGLGGAQVNISGTGSVTTNATGYATFYALADGNYSYTVELDGYQAYQGQVTVQGSAVDVDVNLTPLAVSQVEDENFIYQAYDLSGRALGMGTMRELVLSLPRHGVFLLVGGVKTMKIVK